MDDLKELEHQLRENQKEQTWLEQEIQQLEFKKDSFEAQLKRLNWQLHDQKDHTKYMKLQKQISHAKEKTLDFQKHIRSAHLDELKLRKHISKIKK